MSVVLESEKRKVGSRHTTNGHENGFLSTAQSQVLVVFEQDFSSIHSALSLCEPIARKGKTASYQARLAQYQLEINTKRRLEDADDFLDHDALTEERQKELTAAERIMLEEVVTGATNKEIGANLGISSETVKGHITDILAKTGNKTREGLTIWGINRGLLELVVQDTPRVYARIHTLSYDEHKVLDGMTTDPNVSYTIEDSLNSELNVATKTIKSRGTAVFEKLGVEGRFGAIMFVLQRRQWEESGGRERIVLNDRQKLVMLNLMQGMNDKTIAQVLGIDIKTAAIDRGVLYDKLQVETRAEAVDKALSQGFPIEFVILPSFQPDKMRLLQQQDLILLREMIHVPDGMEHKDAAYRMGRDNKGIPLYLHYIYDLLSVENLEQALVRLKSLGIKFASQSKNGVGK